MSAISAARASEALRLSVSVDHRGAASTVHIKYRDLDQLDEVLRRQLKG